MYTHIFKFTYRICISKSGNEELCHLSAVAVQLSDSGLLLTRQQATKKVYADFSAV